MKNEKIDIIMPARKRRRRALSKLPGDPLEEPPTKRTIAYARVSGLDQRQQLSRQVLFLEAHCVARGWIYEIIKDVGSGLNYQKRGLNKLIQSICSGNMDRLLLTHKDRLLRFGSELIFSLCEKFGIEVVILNQSEDPSCEVDFVEDMLEIIALFAARGQGVNDRNKRLIETLKERVLDETRILSDQ